MGIHHGAPYFRMNVIRSCYWIKSIYRTFKSFYQAIPDPELPSVLYHRTNIMRWEPESNWCCISFADLPHCQHWVSHLKKNGGSDIELHPWLVLRHILVSLVALIVRSYDHGLCSGTSSGWRDPTPQPLHFSSAGGTRTHVIQLMRLSWYHLQTTALFFLLYLSHEKNRTIRHFHCLAVAVTGRRIF